MPSTHQKVVPQPPQIRPVGPSHDGFPPNEALMTPDKIASIQERAYPKWMYCDGEEPLHVTTPEIEETLGSGWRETPEDPNKPAAPVPVPETREEYYKLNQVAVLLVIAQVTDRKILQSMRTSEIANPRRAGGRQEVLEAFEAALTPLEPLEKPADTAPATPKPAVATSPSVAVVDESELEPLAQEKQARGRKSK